MNQLNRVIRRTELTQYVGLKKTQIDQLIRIGEFPQPIRLSDKGRAIAWLEAEVIAWQAKRLAQRRVA